MAEMILQKDLELQKLQMGMPKAMNRTNPTPLDATSVWNSFDELKAYAATNPVAYIGQVLSLVAYDAENEVVTEVKAYIIKDAEGNVEEVGSATLGDNKSIELANGVLSVKDFGKRYYKYVAAVEGGAEAHYELVEVDETNVWSAGLEPKIDANGNIGWYEPNPTTVDGVQDQVVAAQEDIKKAQDDIKTLDETLNAEGGLVDQVEELQNEIGHAANETGDAATGLYAELDKKADADSVYTKTEVDDLIEGVNGTLGDKANAEDVYTKEEVYTKTEADNAIAAAVTAADHLKRKIFDTLALAEEFVTANAATAEQYIYMIPSEETEGSNRYHEYMVLDGKLEEVGNWAVDLSDYFTEAEVKQYLEDYHYSAEEIDNILADYAKATDLDGYYTIAQVDDLLKNYYTKTEIDEKLNGYVAVEEGKSLVSDTEIAKLATVEENAQKNLINSVNTVKFTVTESGQLNLNTLVAADIGDLDELLNNKVDKVFYTVENEDGTSTQVPGTLLSPEDRDKLEALVIGDDGVEISGTVNASKVEGLASWITNNRDTVSGLFSTTEATKLTGIEEGAQKNLINSVETTQFTVDETGKLTLVHAPLFTEVSTDFVVNDNVLGLANTYVTTEIYAAEVGDLAALVHASGNEDSTIVDEINYINERLVWQPLI